MGLGPPKAAGVEGVEAIANYHLVAAKGDYKVKTATSVRSRRLVKRDTTDGEIQVAGAGDVPFGHVAQRVKDGEISLDADFAAGDVVRVLGGPGSVHVLETAVSQTIVKGDFLKAAAAGRVAKWVSGTDAANLIIGRAAESITTDASTNTPIAVEVSY